MTTPEERIALHRAGGHDVDVDPYCPLCPSRAVQYEDPFAPTYEVVFTANLYVTVEALDEDEARARATTLAERVNYQLSNAVTRVREDNANLQWTVAIHTDDIVRVD